MPEVPFPSMIDLSFAIAATALSLIAFSSWRVGTTPIGRAYLGFVLGAAVWAIFRLARAQDLLGGATAESLSLAFALLAAASGARLGALAVSNTGTLPRAFELTLGALMVGVWWVGDPVANSLSASALLAAGSIRLAGLPRRSWDGFASALWSTVGALMGVALLPMLHVAGVPDSALGVIVPFSMMAAGFALLYGLPRLGLLSSGRVQHGRVIQAMNDGVLVVDLRGRLVDFNEAAGEILELDTQQREAKPLEEALENHPDLVELFSGAIDGRSLYSPDVFRRRGEERTFDLQLSALYDASGAIESRVLVLRDISDRMEIERENRRQARHVRLVHEVSAAVHEAETIEAGLQTALVLMARRMEMPLGQFLRSAEEEDGAQLVASGIHYRGLEFVDSPETSAITESDPRGVHWWRALGCEPVFSVPVMIGPRLYGLLEFYAPDAGEVEDSTSEMLDHVGDLVGRAVERKLAQEQIRRLAFRDDLTGLPNRQRFHHLLRGAIGLAQRSSKRMALLFLDLDGFKKVNDTLGHEAGDLLLAEVARRFSTVVRVSDHIERQRGPDAEESAVSRLGGDEFTVLLNEIREVEDAARVAERLLATLETPVKLAGREVFMGTSIGIAVYPEHGQDADGLLRKADAAMYFAKGRGRNSFQFYSEEMDSSKTTQIELEGRLRGALEREEFALHYQPILDPRSGEIVAAEALLRWEDGERGLVPPDVFIPIAEEAGLIVSIGRFVFRTACAEAERWKQELGKTVRIGINVSGHQIREPGMLEMVREAVTDSGIDPKQVDIELTESTIMQDDALTVQTLGELRAMGIGLALDDFGTGYSSLSYLRRFTIDRVKIDRSFVSELPADPDDAALTSAIIAMAHGLRLRVVAEGVETPAQALFLADRDCDEVQGYLFGRPVPSEAFRDRLIAKPVALDALEKEPVDAQGGRPPRR